MKRLLLTSLLMLVAALPAHAVDRLDDGAPLSQAARTEPARDSSQPASLAQAIRTLLDDPKTHHGLAALPGKEWQELSTFYADHADMPLWVDGPTERLNILIDRLSRADEDGLAPRDYPVPALAEAEPTPMKLAARDIALSAAVVAYARDARGARIDLARLSKLITPRLDLPTASMVLSDLLNASDIDSALQAYNPQQPGYRALKAKLATFHDMTASISVPLASSRKPIKTTTAMVADSAITPYDLIANMERWRWVERDLGPKQIVVNLPEFELKLIDHGQVIHQTRAVIGKPDTPTPLFSEKMQYLIVNPSWSVPASIVRKEFLPKLAEDPDFATKAGYEVTQNGDLVTIRQPPGERNALGFVKFMFPNQHAVYLHDTPMRKLFANTDRAYSHGCVRVEDPFALAAVVLNDPRYSEDVLKAMIGKGERVIRLTEPLPVQLTYFTIVADATGELHRFGDVYGYDQAVEAALGLGQPRTYAALR